MTDYFEYAKHYKAESLDDEVNHIKQQINFLCWTAARINTLLDEEEERQKECGSQTGSSAYEIFEKLKSEKGVTTAEVSKATGIRQSTFSNWKSRNGNLSLDNAKKLAEYFGVSIEELLA